MMFGLEFPPIENLVVWPEAFEGSGFNKIALINVIALLGTAAIMVLGAGKKEMVPRGIQAVAEGVVDFINVQVIHPTIGTDKKALSYGPLLLALFLFIFFTNIFEIIPVFQMPANARMANPLLLALLVYFFWIGVTLKHHGVKGITGMLIPPGVPGPLLLLMVPIEFLSNFVIRPFSHAVRLFANMLAGHILLVTFGVLCISVWALSPIIVVEALTFPVLVALTAFEAMVAFLQAYIFTILSGVYIGSALHPDH